MHINVDRLPGYGVKVLSPGPQLTFKSDNLQHVQQFKPVEIAVPILLEARASPENCHGSHDVAKLAQGDERRHQNPLPFDIHITGLG